MEINSVYNMDCVAGMKSLDDNSIDMVMTSPPYDNIRKYHGFTLDLRSTGEEIARVLKDGGICVMVMQDQTVDGWKTGTTFTTVADWIRNTDLKLFETCIYYREGVPGDYWKRRFRVDHEYIIILIKGKRPQYFNNHMREATKMAGQVKKNFNRRESDGKVYKQKKTIVISDTKSQGTVMRYNRSSSDSLPMEIRTIKLQHPATFPDKLAEDFITCFTSEGMTVLDPFMGSGTSARMAIKNNRNYIGFEISSEYCDLMSRFGINVAEAGGNP